MNEMTDSLLNWFSEQPKWLSHATEYVINKEEITPDDIKILTCLCLKEAKKYDIGKQTISLEKFSTEEENEKVYLHSIRDVEGINKLAPGKKLDFNGQDLVVVYGPNGAGKSGYIRLLKHICGARYPGELIPNIYLPLPQKQRAVLSFKKNEIEYDTYEWDKEYGTCKELLDVQFFDSVFGRFFIDDGGKASYEPPLLSLFSKVTIVCDGVRSHLKEIEKHYTQNDMSAYGSLNDANEMQWYLNINHQTKMNEIETHCSFSAEDKSKMEFLETKPNKDKLIKKYQEKQKQKTDIDTFIQNFRNFQNELSYEICEEIVSKKQEYKKMENHVAVMAGEDGNDILLQGVGFKSWLLMWEAAKKYFEEEAYKGKDYSNMSEGEYCVLCQQSIAPRAKERLELFQKFMSHEIQAKAGQIKSEYLQKINEVENIDIPTVEHLNATIKLIGIDEEEKNSEINVSFSQLRERKNELLKTETMDSIISIEKDPQWVSKIRKMSTELGEAVAKLKEQSESPDVQNTQNELNSLSAKQFLSEHRKSVVEKIKRNRKLLTIQEALKKTNTSQLTKKSGELFGKLITEDFQNRFRQELNELGANGIEVEVVKKPGVKAENALEIKISESIQENTKKLQISNILSNILSEGENRIVSIAAFLADATGRESYSPFLFDDPISSLDHDFERAVVKRLVRLSNERQVIIFTHRLSLLASLTHLAKKKEKDINVLSIGASFLGTGAEVPIPFSQGEINGMLKNLIEDDCSEIEKEYEAGNFRILEKLVDSLYKNFRKIIERIIEEDLLCGVSQRYQISVKTDNLKYLKNLKKEACDFLDNLMTEYSIEEHSQPLDTPINNPAPKILSEIKKDIEELIKWRKDYRRQSGF